MATVAHTGVLVRVTAARIPAFLCLIHCLAMPFVTLIFSVGDEHGSWLWEATEGFLVLCVAGIAMHKAWKLREHAPRVSAAGFAGAAGVLAFTIFAHGLLPIGLLALLAWQVWSERHCCHT